MPTLKRLVTTHAPAEGVFAYLSDFAHAAECDRLGAGVLYFHELVFLA